MNEIVFDDGDIAGITFSGTIVASRSRSLIDGDFDGDIDIDIDGDSDGFDFLLWQRGEPSDPLTASDLAEWEASYGTAPPLSALEGVSAVPEPSAGQFLVAAATFSNS